MAKFILKGNNDVQMEVYFQKGSITVTDEIIKISLDHDTTAHRRNRHDAPITVKRPFRRDDDI